MHAYLCLVPMEAGFPETGATAACELLGARNWTLVLEAL